MKTVDVVVAKSVEAVEAFRPVWHRLGVPDIDADIDYFLAVVQALAPSAQPHVIHIRKTDGRDLLVVARIEELRLAFKIGYFTLGHVRQRAVIVSFDGILGARGRADEELALAELRKTLKGEADLAVIRNLDLTGERLAAAKSVVPWFARGHGQLPSRRWVIDLPESLEAFLARRSTSTRKKLRWEERSLAKHFAGALRVRRYERPEEMEELCADITAVAARSYQHTLGAAFSNSPLDRALLHVGLEQGWTRVWVLYLDDRPVAFWPGTAYGSTFAVGTPGFDPEFSKHAVGRYTMLRMIDDLCKDPGVSVVDFGQGEAEYKAQFGRPVRLERDVMMAAMRPWPLLVLWGHSLFTLANGTARQFASSIGWVGRLKTYWRKRGSVATADTEVTS
jgi:CelD/BcsL family acetyltransferase involved in cellulose biosynthesis